MGRGKKKLVEERIEEKLALIESLKIRLSKEQKELAELQQEKRNNDMAGISELLSDCNISIDEAKRVLEDYVSGQIQEEIA